jgi:hypothetical protein
MLYPTEYIEESNTIQWHLERKAKHFKGGARSQGIAPDAVSRYSWLRIPVVEKLQGAWAVLGYCSEVEIQLGTQEQLPYHTNPYDSCTDVEQSQREFTGDGSFGLTLSIPGFGSFSTGKHYKLRNS